MPIKILLNFKRFSDNDLLAFAIDIVDNMKNNAAYAPEATRVNAVDTALQAYNLAVAKASDGGRTLKNIRTEKKLLLLQELDLLATQLSMYVDKEPSFFTATGFRLRKTPGKYDGPLPKAVLKYLKRGEKSGTVDGETLGFPESVKEIAVEYSFDKGTSWKNGTYSTGKRFTVNNLPIKQDCQIRVCFLGTRQRKGDWSEPMNVLGL